MTNLLPRVALRPRGRGLRSTRGYIPAPRWGERRRTRQECRLEIDHTIPISQGGTDEEHNLRAVCVWYNKYKANLKVPTSRDAISAMALIRRQPRNVQQEVYDFLSKKFGQKPGGK